MPKPQTKASTRPLSEVARHLIYPAGIVTTGYPRIAARLADMRIAYDGWQQGAATLMLGRDASGRYAATVGGVTMSIPRQVGKTFTIGSLLIAMCIEYPGLRVVWTSHHLRTTTNTFRSMQGMVRNKKILPHLERNRSNGIRTANGEQEIAFANGSIIMFGARERGFGVGIDAIDVLVCDEAQRLSSRALADMIPTTNQARHEHGALPIFIGTPPRPTDEGDEFRSRRTKALEGRMDNGIYIEMSADLDASPDDPEQWARANPSYPHRTPHESMLRLRENLTDNDDWLREALGIWPDTTVTEPPVISPDEWESARVDKAPADGLPCYGVRYSPDGAVFAVSVALKRNDAPVFVEVIDRESTSVGVGGLADWLAARWAESGCIVIDGKSHEGALIEALLDRGVPPKWIKKPTMTEIATAYPMFLEWVRTGRLQHAGAQGLTDSVAAAARRKIGNLGGWGFQPNSLEGDVVPAESAVLAVAGTTLTKRKPGMPSADGGRVGGARKASSGRRATVR